MTYTQGFQCAVETARRHGVHWTTNERQEHLDNAIEEQEYFTEHPEEDTEDLGFGEELIAAYKSDATAPLANGHNWEMSATGHCQICQTEGRSS